MIVNEVTIMKETDEYIQFNDLNKYNEIIHFYSKKFSGGGSPNPLALENPE